MTGTMSLHFIVVVNLSLLSSFKPTTPPHKLFKDKRVEFFLVCIGSCQEVDQVFVCDFSVARGFFTIPHNLNALNRLN